MAKRRNYGEQRVISYKGGRKHSNYGVFERTAIIHPGTQTPWKELLNGQTNGTRECQRRMRQMARAARHG